MARLATEVDVDNINLINTFISEKNTLLSEKRNALLDQINWNRTRIEKVVKALNVLLTGSREGPRIGWIRPRNS